MPNKETEEVVTEVDDFEDRVRTIVISILNEVQPTNATNDYWEASQAMSVACTALDMVSKTSGDTSKCHELINLCLDELIAAKKPQVAEESVET